MERDTFSNLRIFDLLDQTCTAELLQRGTHEVLARSLHGIYLENSQSLKETKQAMMRSCLGMNSPHISKKITAAKRIESQ